MKRFVLIILMLLSSPLIFSQGLDWQRMNPQQRRELISKMSPEERAKMVREFKENMMVTELDIPQQKEGEFRDLYEEYQQKQREIKNKFQRNENFDNLTDEEAERQLNQSFEVAQQLIENRKKYAEKFKKIMRTQQVLELFQKEGMMREKMMERQGGGFRNNGGDNPYRNGGMEQGFRKPKRP